MIVHEKLEELAPILLYKFVCHPTSFSRTVENLFYVSFLVSDNKVKLERGEGSEWIIHVNEQHEDETKDNRGQKHQQIFRMTMSFWREQVSKHDIRTPLIPIN